MRALHVSIQPYTENKNRAVQKFHTGCVILKWLKLKDEKVRKNIFLMKRWSCFKKTVGHFPLRLNFERLSMVNFRTPTYYDYATDLLHRVVELICDLHLVYWDWRHFRGVSLQFLSH